MSFRKKLFVEYSETVFGVNMKHLRRRDLPGVSYDEFQKLKSLPFFLTDDGKVYINTSNKANMTFLHYFLSMSDSSTASLLRALEEAEVLYPDVKEPEDVLKCKAEDQAKAGFKIMIPYELQRREKELNYYKSQNKF